MIRRTFSAVTVQQNPVSFVGQIRSIYLPPSWRFRVLLVVLALGGAGCFGTRDETRVSATYRDDRVIPRSQATITLTDGRHRYVLTGTALDATDGESSRPLNSAGELDVLVALVDARGPIATGRFATPLAPDRIYGIDIRIDSVNPQRFCFGCVASFPFPLRSDRGRSARDSMWVTYGYNSIRNPVVF